MLSVVGISKRNKAQINMKTNISKTYVYSECLLEVYPKPTLGSHVEIMSRQESVGVAFGQGSQLDVVTIVSPRVILVNQSCNPCTKNELELQIQILTYRLQRSVGCDNLFLGEKRTFACIKHIFNTKCGH